MSQMKEELKRLLDLSDALSAEEYMEIFEEARNVDQLEPRFVCKPFLDSDISIGPAKFTTASPGFIFTSHRHDSISQIPDCRGADAPEAGTEFDVFDDIAGEYAMAV